MIGLTGGIASGKSTVAGLFQEAGAVVLNADHLGRLAVLPGEPALAELVCAFGPEILLPNGQLNRALLGERVFESSAQLARLNQIVHPRIEAGLIAVLTQLAASPPVPPALPLVVLEAALLLDAGWDQWVDLVAVVDVQPEVQVARLKKDLGLAEVEAWQRVRSQLPREDRLERAAEVIDGATPLPLLRQQVERLCARWSRDPGSEPGLKEDGTSSA